MNWSGKIIGFCVGYLFFREIGAVIGLLAGHYVDLTRITTHGGVRMNAQQRYFIQQAYFKATFLIMGHIAKADGRISENEIMAARTIMKNMNLTESQKREAIRLFNMGKAENFNMIHALEELYKTCGNQPDLYRMFIDIQFRAANASGFIGPVKHQILDYICRQLGFQYTEFAAFYEQYQSGKSRQSSGSQYEQAQQQRQQRANQKSPPDKYAHELENAYATLGASKTDADSVIKKKYRKKMSENHPDKLISKGLPEEMIKLATQKTQAIKGAYDIIKAARESKS